MSHPNGIWSAAALLGIPLLALANLTLTYALVPLACSQRSVAMLHGTSIVSTTIAVLVTVSAAKSVIRTRGRGRAGKDVGGMRQFIPMLGALSGALFTLVIIVQWVAIWVVPPCVA